MPDTNQGTQAGGTPLWRRRRFWLAGGGILTGLAALAAVAPRASAYRILAGHGFGGHGRHGFGAQILNDPAAAKQHAGMAVEWALRGVNGTEEQKQQARRITDRLIDELGPSLEKHRGFREAMARELAKPEIDREALERLRQEEIAFADTASKRAVAAIADLGEVLTPEQRADLVAFAHRFHGEGTDRHRGSGGCSAGSSPSPRTSCARRWRGCACRSRCSRATRPSRSARHGTSGSWTRSSASCSRPAAWRPSASPTAARRSISWASWPRAVVEGEPALVRGDPRLLRRLVRNLLDNARRHAAGADVEARVERVGEGARLTVADRGPGVPEAQRERIFEPFYRPPGTPETGASFGLGLALVRQIARAHGGEARCLPRDGGGTVFEATLGT
jgi:Spy/CpxP family protein refolding chaperone